MKKCIPKVLQLFYFILISNCAIAQSDIYFADPTIFYYNDYYYMYGTGIKGIETNNGIPVLQSKDMKTWEVPADALNGYALKNGESTYGTENFWAPHVFKRDETFYMFYTANEYNAVAQSSSPTGLFTQNTIGRLVTDNKQIDAFIFFDDDGKIYYYHVRFTDGNEIWVAELKNDFSGIHENTLTKCIGITEPWEHTGSYPNTKVIEGPTVVKRNGKYYLFYSGNGFQSIDYSVGYAVSDSPYGPWTKPDNNPIISRHNIGENGTGHGDVFQDAEGQWHYIFHAHYNSTTVFPRRTFIVELEFSNETNAAYETISAKPETLIKPQMKSDVYYISPGGCGEKTGTDWENALDLSTESLALGKSGDEFWVKEGEYQVNIEFTNRILYGGFDGSENNLSQRDWTKNKTIIKGTANAGKPLVNMMLSAVLDGFIIQDNQNSTVNGGGVHLRNKGIIRNCIIRNNSVGGANVGGGVFVDGVITDNIYPTIENCLIINNASANNGGGVQVANNMMLHIINSTIANNKITKPTGQAGSGFGCGIGLPVNAKMIAENCIVYNNQKPHTEGTLTFSFGANYDMNNNANSIVRNCAFDSINVGNGTKNSVIFVEKTNCIDNLSLTQTPGFVLASTFTGSVLAETDEYLEFESVDYGLISTSICVDAGNNAYTTVEKDLAGKNRIYNATVDIGAYEYKQEQTTSTNNIFQSINFYTGNDLLTVYDLSIGDNISVFNVLGKLIFSSEITENTIHIPLTNKGIYIIKTGNQSQKIIF